jgi:murein DD-endopeptidase MepM/ murein hydrolase activator NlpD
MRPLLLACASALAVAPSAFAHTDATKQLGFEWPAQGTVTSPYGRDGARWHPGLDIGILRSLEVRAAASGTVVGVGSLSGYEGYGSVVLVDVGNGFTTLYAHLSSPRVKVGQYVAEDELVGIAGCTGWCTGTHLHFEVRLDGAAVDPTPLLDPQ